MNLLNTIGNTAIVKLENYNTAAELYVKMEARNPGGSVKDRAALFMINGLSERGELRENSKIVVPTSGNTGIGLALICAIKKIGLVLTMPESMSIERRAILAAYGAEIVLTEASKGMNGAILKAEELVKEKGYILLDQFSNKDNARAHYETTGPEIFNTIPDLDIFVAGVGTGGTITGTGHYLKKKNANIKLVAVEPYESAVLSGEKANPHLIQGIGAGFIPSILDVKIIDEIIKVKGEDAIKTAKSLFVNEGISCGISCGAAFHAALELAKRAENKGKKILAILPDGGERYLSTKLFV